MSLDPDRRDTLRHNIQARVGGFFCNTRREAGLTCQVCTGPATASLCGRCATQRRTYGDRLADRVLTLTYVRGRMPSNHQSVYTVFAYKNLTHPVGKCLTDLGLMIKAATALHGDCIAREAGGPWTVVTFVPSAARPGLSHPVSQFVHYVAGASRPETVVLDLGPSAAIADRQVLPDRFAVPDHAHATIVGQHVLILDDTWTSGAKAQSAALAVRAAGADQITILCVARWCRYDLDDHRALLDTCTEPYDPAVCPVGSTACRM
ncbi:MAG: hypothetical protein GXX79_21990 [Actinomycetales bacterium]|nr:hypothetical protein [Actinomycetales bacterium]